MKTYGQFCSVARALDLLGERWTLLVVRELLSGTTHFNDIRRGIPRISRTMLAERLRELRDAGAVVRRDGEGGPAYALTEAGVDLANVVREIGTWGQRWLPRTLPKDELDGEALLWDVHRRVRCERLPARPLVVRIELTGAPGPAKIRFLLLRRTEVSLCVENPGFPVELELTVRRDLPLPRSAAVHSGVGERQGSSGARRVHLDGWAASVPGRHRRRHDRVTSDVTPRGILFIGGSPQGFSLEPCCPPALRRCALL